MRHLLLIGEFELGIDDKNRLSLPSDIRKAINSDRDGDAFFLVLGRNGKPWLYPELYYEQMVFQEQPEITPEEEQLDFDHMNFALADKVTWDSQGRMLIPDKTLKRTGLGKEVTMIVACPERVIRTALNLRVSAWCRLRAASGCAEGRDGNLYGRRANRWRAAMLRGRAW